MSIINRTKSSLENMYESAASKWSSFKSNTNDKTLWLGEQLSKNYNWIRSESEERYNSLSHRFKVRKYRFKKKLNRKWDRKWSNYYNYFLWTFTPYVLVYGLALNFILAQIGVFALTPSNLAATGMAFYFAKIEFVEWINEIDWLRKDGSSEV